MHDHSKQTTSCMSFVADLRDTIHGLPLHIGGYHIYHHHKLQASQVTITQPDSTVSAFEVLLATLLKV